MLETCHDYDDAIRQANKTQIPVTGLKWLLMCFEYRIMLNLILLFIHIFKNTNQHIKEKSCEWWIQLSYYTTQLVSVCLHHNVKQLDHQGWSTKPNQKNIKTQILGHIFKS